MSSELIEISKDLGKVEATAKEAHSRIDRVERQVLTSLEGLQVEVGKIREWMHKTQGRDTTLFVVGTVLGSVISFALQYLLKGGH